MFTKYLGKGITCAWGLLFFSLIPLWAQTDDGIVLLHRLSVFQDVNRDGEVDSKEYIGFLRLGQKLEIDSTLSSMQYYGKSREMYQIHGGTNDFDLTKGPTYTLAAYIAPASGSSRVMILSEALPRFSEAKLTAIDPKGQRVPAGSFVVELSAEENVGEFMKVTYVQGETPVKTFIQTPPSEMDVAEGDTRLTFLQIARTIDVSKSPQVKDGLINYIERVLRPDLVGAIADMADSYEITSTAVQKARNASSQPFPTAALNFSQASIPVYALPNSYTYQGYFSADGSDINLVLDDRTGELVGTVQSSLASLGEFAGAEGKYLAIVVAEDHPEYGGRLLFVPSSRIFKVYLNN